MADDACEHSLRLENEKYYYRRLCSDSFFLRKSFGNPLRTVSIDITGSRAIIGTARTQGGSLLFRTAEGDIRPPSDLFGIYIPPYSIYTTVSDFDTTELALCVTSRPEVTEASGCPLIFPSGISDYNGTDRQNTVLLAEMRAGGASPLSHSALPAAEEAKNLIDSGYQDIKGISEIAKRLGLENWELSRAFKQSYGITPLKYLNNLRTIEAVYRLIRDGRKSKIIDVAFNVGFRDLSRFNKQFKSFVRFIPKNLLAGKD